MYVLLAATEKTRARAWARTHVRARDSGFRDPTHVTGSKREITNPELVNAERRSGLIIACIDSLMRADYYRHA